MKSTLLYMCLAAVLLLLAACATTPEPTEPIEITEEAPNPFVGTWVLNVGKSTFNPPESALQSDVVVIEAQENGLKFTFDYVDAEGNAIHVEQAPKWDGEDYPVTGDPTADTASLKRVNANTFEHVSKKDGEEVTRVQVVISEDGMTSTATLKAKDAEGQEVTSIYIYDKQ